MIWQTPPAHLYDSRSGHDMKSKLSAAVLHVEEASLAVSSLIDETAERLEKVGLTWGSRQAFVSYVERVVMLRALCDVVQAVGLGAYEREIVTGEIDRLFPPKRVTQPSQTTREIVVQQAGGQSKPLSASLLPNLPDAGRNLLTGVTSHGIATRSRRQ